ncbi:hypothetical protein GALL_295330 [mine drainage metagenome]|uniref:Uncharacterized protein n=1 Tax=mine drainage metagenome TaxID=410659 RepID=A0A1J5QZD2_9ZZZZ
MNEKINEIVGRMKSLELELEAELDQAREKIHYRLDKKKVRFERDALLQQRQHKINLFRYAFFPRPRHVLAAPFIFVLLPALLLLDLLASLYHAVCFPLLEIPKVRRSDYLVFDRHHLAYLNLLEMINCAYCSYGNGLLAYLTEIIGRTEQYWCPIKHAHRVLTTHARYRNFMEYGDAEGFRRDLKEIRRFKD